MGTGSQQSKEESYMNGHAKDGKENKRMTEKRGEQQQQRKTMNKAKQIKS
jgi:hypothetical protein